MKRATRFARILQPTTQLFLEAGYEQASIDAILLRSGGSNSTLYSDFPTKKDLFRSVIDNIVDSSDIGAALDVTAPPRTVLTEFTVSRQRIVLSPQHRAVRRLVIAERDRFPDLARIYWERGPHKSIRQLVTYLEALRNREMLDVDDAEEAAEFFIGMLFQSARCATLPRPHEATGRAGDAHARRARRGRFWAAYRRHPH